jgi:glycosyltransferase 2 family protein
MNQQRIRTLMLVVGIPAIVIAGWYAYGDIQQLEAPPLWALIPAAVANLVALVLSARSWSVLIDDVVPRHTLDDAFYTSQLMKYTPVGGVAQALGQAALAQTDEVGMTRAGTAMVVSKLTTVLAASLFGPLLAVSGSELPGWVRLVLVATPVLLVFGHRGLMAWALEHLRNVIPRVPEHTDLPSQGRIWRSVAWGVASLALSGIAFSTLAITAGLGVGWVQAVSGFALAWAIGFLAIPIPAGIGVREAALGLLVAGNPGALLVSAVLFRGVAIGTEAIMFAKVRLAARFGGAREPNAEPPDVGPEPGPTGVDTT